MDFNDVKTKVTECLTKIGSSIGNHEYDGIIVKRLEASNTLDKGRTTNQSHIAITGDQMDMFPYVRSDGYFKDDYGQLDGDLKKYFVAQVPAVLHKENIDYLDSDANIFTDDERMVYVSIVRSRRKGAADQLQMSMTNMDSPEYVAYRRIVHAGSYLIMLKRKAEMKYDIYSVKPSDSESLYSINNVFVKLPTNTPVHVDKLLDAGTDDIRFKTSLPKPESRNRIIFGAPGTGKSYMINEQRIKLLGADNESDYERVTFHPDYTYANFVGTYKPVPCKDDDGKDAITYEYVPGPFMRVYVSALKNAMTGNPKPYLLIIEEINRANVAAVFGDVFQLLDRDDDEISEYPIQASEDIKKYLAKELKCSLDKVEKIKIPNNMFIWATMNSADQGVFPMDTAFKRRWDFTYLGIDDSDKDIRGKYATVGSKEKQRIEWNELRKAINEFLADEKINEDKQLGPYFISRNIVVPASGNEIDSEKFCDVFKHKVLMYLFDDAAKQKRAKLFEGSAKGQARYSKICEAFDEQGIGIFHADIQNRVKIQDLVINAHEVDENGMIRTETDTGSEE